MLRTRAVSAGYGLLPVLNGIDLSVAPGEIVGLLGRNGAGKTTLLRVIAGGLKASGGAVVLGDQDLTNAPAFRRARAGIAHVPQGRGIFNQLTVRQNLSVFAQLYAVADIEGRIASLAADLELTEFLDRQTGKLSAGQKTRVSLAKALLNHPEILLLDEPTASLDPDTADWVRSRLEHYRTAHGATILLASHNMNEVERLCERVIIMKTGRIEDDDTPHNLLNCYGRETLEQVFLDVARGQGQHREAAQ